MARRRRTYTRRRRQIRRRVRIPPMLARGDMFLSGCSPQPRAVIRQGDAWLRRTIGAQEVTGTSGSAQIGYAFIREFIAPSANVKIRWIAIWGSIGNPLTVVFPDKRRFMQVNGNSAADFRKVYQDQGSGFNLPKIMVRIPVSLQLATDNATETICTVDLQGAALYSVRIGLSFLY